MIIPNPLILYGCAPGKAGMVEMSQALWGNKNNRLNDLEIKIEV